jgi:hypothetical protein
MQLGSGEVRNQNMKLRICLAMILGVFVALAEQQPASKKERAKKSPPPPAELTIPAGAKQVDAATYTFTDAQGKNWISRKTPFGVARLEDKPAEASATTVAPGADITATEDGDTVRFERPGPFGTYRWQKKKSELAEDEKAAWERSQAKDAAPAKAKQE